MSWVSLLKDFPSDRQMLYSDEASLQIEMWRDLIKSAVSLMLIAQFHCGTEWCLFIWQSTIAENLQRPDDTEILRNSTGPGSSPVWKCLFVLYRTTILTLRGQFLMWFDDLNAVVWKIVHYISDLRHHTPPQAKNKYIFTCVIFTQWAQRVNVRQCVKTHQTSHDLGWVLG